MDIKNFTIDDVTTFCIEIQYDKDVETIKDDSKIVTEEEFIKYLKSYPNKLEKDYYMDWYSWNDFTLGKWPESMVAMCSDGSYNQPIVYKILK